MWAAQGKIKKKYNIEDEREAMFTAVYHWADAVEKSVGGPFQGGAVPSVADLCVFGCKGIVFLIFKYSNYNCSISYMDSFCLFLSLFFDKTGLRSIDGLDTHTEVVNDVRIRSWYDAMAVAVGPSEEER